MTTVEEEVKKAVKVLSDGGIILYPTETVWGIGCLATDDKAVRRIYELKKREDSKAMTVLVSSYEMACRYVQQMPELAVDLWNLSTTPLTLVLPEGRNISPLLIPEERTIGIRVTSNEFCRRVISALRTPIVSTSANISGQPSAVHLKDVCPEILQGVDLAVDSSMEKGATGKPSSVISLDMSSVVKILRK